jgi:hypothetical protein
MITISVSVLFVLLVAGAFLRCARDTDLKY